MNFLYAHHALDGLKAAILLIGLAVVFVWKSKNSKPMFVKVIWFLICIAELASIAGDILQTKKYKLRYDEDERDQSLWPYLVLMWTIQSVFVSFAHWIFAI